MCITKLPFEISQIGVLFMQNIYAVEYNNFGMDLNYEIYDSLSSAKEIFNELVGCGRYDMVLLCKKYMEIKAKDTIELFIDGIRQMNNRRLMIGIMR